MKAAEIIVASLTSRKSCVKCKGEFQKKEQVYLDTYNKSYCEVCFEEGDES